MNEQELELATKKEYKLSQEEKIILSDQWIDIENQDCDLRIMRQKKVKLVKYNYFDEHSQAGRTGLNHAHAKGLPIIIMEPLRGGKLVNNLPEKAMKLLET